MNPIRLLLCLATALFVACSGTTPPPQAPTPQRAKTAAAPALPAAAPATPDDIAAWDASISCLQQEGLGCAAAAGASPEASGSGDNGSGSGSGPNSETAAYLRATMLLRDACTRHYAPACGALAKQLYKAGPNGGSAGQARELAKRGCEGHHLASCSLLISLARGEADQLSAAENFLLARCNGIVPEACVALGRGYAAQAIPQGDRGLMNGLFTRGCDQKVADGCAELAAHGQAVRLDSTRIARRTAGGVLGGPGGGLSGSGLSQVGLVRRSVALNSIRRNSNCSPSVPEAVRVVLRSRRLRAR
jgi:hypothetical protein